jgi:hypothetical protein
MKYDALRKNTKRDEKMRRYHREHPELSHTEVAEHFGLKLTRQRIGQILNNGVH